MASRRLCRVFGNIQGCDQTPGDITQANRAGLLGTLIILGVFVGACGPTNTGSHATSTPHDDKNTNEAFFFSGWTIKSAAGTKIKLGDVVAGDIAMINFFATYCTRCKQKLIDHQKLHEKYQKDGLSVLGVSVDEPETHANVSAYVRVRGLSFPVVIDSESILVSHLNPKRTLPFSVLIDRTGKVRWSHVGYPPGDEKIFEKQIVEALKLKSISD